MVSLDAVIRKGEEVAKQAKYCIASQKLQSQGKGGSREPSVLGGQDQNSLEMDQPSGAKVTLARAVSQSGDGGSQVVVGSGMRGRH